MAILLTVDNADEIGQRIRFLLTDKRYTFIAFNEIFGFRPSFQRNQYLEPGRPGTDPINVNFYNYDDGSKAASINVHDTYGVWGMTAREETWVTFSDNTVVIKHRAGAGNRIYWVVAVE